MERDQAHTQNELLKRIAVALEKGNTTKAVELSGDRNSELTAKGILDVVGKITDDYASNKKIQYKVKDHQLVPDIPGFEGTLDKLDNLTKHNSKCTCASCEENPTTTWSKDDGGYVGDNKELHESKLHTDEGDCEEDDTVHNDYLNEIVEDMNHIEYLGFCHDMGYVSNDPNRVTSNINELEYEECLGAIKRALLISGDDDYIGATGGDEDAADNYVKDKLDGIANLKADDPYTYDNNLRELHCGVVNDSDFNIRKAALGYEAAIDEDLHTKKECILNYVTETFGSQGARYTDIIKFAYYLGSPNAPKYTNDNRGYYSCGFAMRYGGHLIHGGKDQLVKGINQDGNEKYFALSNVESVTDYWKRLDE
jgi:hypothetical protein